MVVICAFTLAAFAGIFDGDFQYDDVSAILENPHLDGWRNFVGHLDHMVRPVLYSTFLFDRSLYVTNPAGYHLLNLLLHLGSGLLVYRILSSAAADERFSVPFWTSLFFLIHLIVTETVSYISGRASGLMAFFLYIKASQEFRTALPRWYYLSGTLTFNR